mmetsp:Transcript_13983/g.32854  ORF Transcript_13983/g.32854 Transcript_13983/m.32854 type:complete len:208 (-) Transcript_13983:947-1570(-)
MHGKPSRTWLHFCGEGRPDTDVLQTFAAALNDPLRHVALRQEQTLLPTILDGHHVTSASAPHLLAIQCVQLLVPQPMDCALTLLTAEAAAPATSKLHGLTARVGDFHLKAEGPCPQGHSVDKAEAGPLLRHRLVSAQAERDSILFNLADLPQVRCGLEGPGDGDAAVVRGLGRTDELLARLWQPPAQHVRRVDAASRTAAVAQVHRA